MKEESENELWEWDAVKGSVITRLEYELEATRKELNLTRDYYLSLVLDLMKRNKGLTNEE